MDSFNENINELKKQLEKGVIQKAYSGLMEYIMDLRTYFKKKYTNYFVSGSIYYGYMDMSYFSFMSKKLKNLKLKVAIVFNFESFRFEVWLGGYNKKVQETYWNLVKEKEWNKYNVPSSIKGIDSIVEYVLVDNPDFSDLKLLTNEIEKGTLNFIKDVEEFLVSY